MWVCAARQHARCALPVAACMVEAVLSCTSFVQVVLWQGVGDFLTVDSGGFLGGTFGSVADMCHPVYRCHVGIGTVHLCQVACQPAVLILLRMKAASANTDCLRNRGRLCRWVWVQINLIEHQHQCSARYRIAWVANDDTMPVAGCGLAV
jgi:hypothetical protein